MFGSLDALACWFPSKFQKTPESCGTLHFSKCALKDYANTWLRFYQFMTSYPDSMVSANWTQSLVYEKKKKNVMLRGRCVVGAGRVEVKESGISMAKIQCKYVWIFNG